MENEKDVEKQNAYIIKKTLISNCMAEKDIDRYDYEANCFGCKIEDYDKFRRHRTNEILLMIGVLGLYFFIGLLTGAVIIASYVYHI